MKLLTKKIITFLLVFVMILSALPAITVTQADSFQRGDANMDSVIDLVDATYIQRALEDMDGPDYGSLRISDPSFKVADVDCDRTVTVVDVTHLQRYCALIGTSAEEHIGELISEGEEGAYYLRLVYHGGRIESNADTYSKGDIIHLEAIPEEGYSFDSWHSTAGGTFDSYTSASADFTAPDGPVVIIANFTKTLPQPETADEQAVLDAYSQLMIGYADGDDKDSVISNLTLVNTIGEGENEVSVSWSSSDEGIIGRSGYVSRPWDDDAVIFMTAYLSRGDAELTKDFTLIVKKRDDNDTGDIKDNSYTDLVDLNKDDPDLLRIDYNEDQTRVEYIRGTFSKIKVDNAQAAKQSLESVRSLIGFNDNRWDLSCAATSRTEKFRSYSFDQTYYGIPVYGVSVNVIADVASGKTCMLKSSVVSGDVLENVDTEPTYTADELKAQLEIETDTEPKLYIYSLDSFNEAPILVYKITVGERVYLIDAHSADMISSFCTSSEWSYEYDTGKGEKEAVVTNEGQENEIVTYSDVEFPVERRFFNLGDIPMISARFQKNDRKRGIKVEGDTASVFDSSDNQTGWKDKTANSAYANVRDAYEWYLDQFERKSFDNDGIPITVQLHSEGCGAQWKNILDQHFIEYYDNPDTIEDRYDRTSAGASDITFHEFTHGVVFCSNGELKPENYTGSINEGYADTFAYFIDHDNTELGENWPYTRKSGTRSVEVPESKFCPASTDSKYYMPVWFDDSDNDIKSVAEFLVAYLAENTDRNYSVQDILDDPETEENALEEFIADRKGITVDELKNGYYEEKKGYNYEYNTIELILNRLYYRDYLVDQYQACLVHTNSSLISHAAYLMDSYGVDFKILKKIWYDSMTLEAYDAQSTFQDVRKTVVGYAMLYYSGGDLTAEDYANIRKAFDDVGIYDEDERCVLRVKCVDEDNNPITQSVLVDLKLIKAERNAPENEINTTFLSTISNVVIKDSRNLNPYVGEYQVIASAPGYGTVTGTVTLDNKYDKTIYIVLTDGNSNVGIAGGVIASAQTGLPISDACYEIHEGLDAPEGPIVASGITGDDGRYQETLPEGYYTLIATHSDYKKAKQMFAVDRNECHYSIDVYMQPEKGGGNPSHDNDVITFDVTTTDWEMTDADDWVGFIIFSMDGVPLAEMDNYSGLLSEGCNGSFRSESQKGVKNYDGTWSYNLSEHGVTIEDGKTYAVTFYEYEYPGNYLNCTYSLLFDKSCLGHTAFCDGTEYSVAIDGGDIEKSYSLVAKWDSGVDADRFGPQLMINLLGEVTGSVCPAVITNYKMYFAFLHANKSRGLRCARRYGKLTDQEIVDIAYTLHLTDEQIQNAIDGKDENGNTVAGFGPVDIDWVPAHSG